MRVVRVVGRCLRRGRVSEEERRLIYKARVSRGSTVKEKRDSLSTKEDLAWLAVLFVFSNHCPASLLSPELVLLERSCGERLDGGLALLLASVGELFVVGVLLGWRFDTEDGGLWRRETD
jgi:hypothetical protein